MRSHDMSTAYENITISGGGPGAIRFEAAPTLDSDHVGESRLDVWRLLMVDLAHLVGAYCLDIRILEGIQNRRDSFDDLARVYTQLSRLPNHDGNFLVRFRLAATNHRKPQNDYTLQLGDVAVDRHTVTGMFNRGGVRTSHLPGRLSKTFATYDDYGISTLRVFLPPNGEVSPHLIDIIRDTLNIISRFAAAARNHSPIVFEKDGQKNLIPITLDETGRPDLNLTLLSGLNGIDPKVMQSMVRKVGLWMEQLTLTEAGNPFVNVYEAMLGEKNLKKRLVRPPIEVNNIKWMGLTNNYAVLPRQKARVFKLAADLFKDIPHQAALAIQTVYGGDYGRIGAAHLTERLGMASEMLQASGHVANPGEVRSEIVSNLHQRIEQVTDEVLRRLRLSGGGVASQEDRGETTMAPLHESLRESLSARMRRVKESMPEAIPRHSAFAARFEALNRGSGLTAEEAGRVSDIIASCLDVEETFQRNLFENRVAEYAQSGLGGFRILWRYLKGTQERQERLSVLNALKLLCFSMTERSGVIELLLSEVFGRPDQVGFCDRNALMLCNMLVRKYNKELKMDIEMTPEEVLLTQEGLDKDLARRTSVVLERNRDKVMQKGQTILKHLMDSLERGDEGISNARFLMMLQREGYILLALTGGHMARYILSNVVRRHGDPVYEIYRSRRTRELLDLFIQQLTVAVRALGRIGNRRDLPTIHRARKVKGFLMALCGDARQTSRVEYLMDWMTRTEEAMTLRPEDISSGLMAL